MVNLKTFIKAIKGTNIRRLNLVNVDTNLRYEYSLKQPIQNIKEPLKMKSFRKYKVIKIKTVLLETQLIIHISKGG